jgi:Cu-Zn family superoxide dismutase
MLVYGEITGLPPNSVHGLHINIYGDISNKCRSGSTHYNPHNVSHGGLDTPIRHPGDFGNIMADQDGVSIFNKTASNVYIYGNETIIGRGCYIH